MAVAGWMFCGSSLLASPHALIVTGLTGSTENAEDFRKLSLETKRLLVERGLSVENVEIMGDKVTREAILSKLKVMQSVDDEFWLVLYGHSGRSQGDVPAFQVSGPRLTADDLKQALDAIPARQFVFIGTNDSGAYLPILQNPRRAVVSATKAEGEGDQPRFPDKWVEAFAENPKAAFAWIAARTSVLVNDYYKNSSLAQIEHARLADPVTGTILEPPFGVDLNAPAETRLAPAGPTALLTASDIKVKIADPNVIWEHQAPTEETKRVMAKARAVPNPDGYSAIILDQRIGLTVEDDRTTDRVMYIRVFIAKEDAVSRWANYFLPESAPIVTSKLEVARVIQPDGSSTVFNPAKLLEACDSPAESCSPMSMVFLPNTHAGCVVEIGYRIRQLLNASMPEVTESLDVQQEAPALSTEIEVRVPEKQTFHVDLRNNPAPPVTTKEDGRIIYHWQLAELPAIESLVGDPPRQLWTTWLAVSSLASWDSFAAWYRRIARDSDAVDDTVRKTAGDLTEGAATRTEKIKRMFEFVSALRYVAIEIGVQGFRPRTPAQVLTNRYGDCKDKANLLIAMLRSQKINASFVLLNRGGITDVNFPSWQFNHAICYVPKSSDTADGAEMWLDSTDSVTPFGFVPPGDAGRQGLVFESDKAEFKTIASSASELSSLGDMWDLEQTPDGGWSGTFRRNATGLIEYGLRMAFSSASPAQRSMLIYETGNALWPAGNFSTATVNDTSVLGQPLELQARVVSQDATLPLPGFPWLEEFAAPTRDRPLWLNDGQPFGGTQTVRLHYTGQAPAALPEPLQLQAGGTTLGIVWRRVDDKTVERVTRVDLKTPIVPAADYAGLRSALRKWSAVAVSR
ncbi:MAG: DUF3857 domain-containing protein [Chthoniobacteraceae bacterium]